MLLRGWHLYIIFLQHPTVLRMFGHQKVWFAQVYRWQLRVLLPEAAQALSDARGGGISWEQFMNSGSLQYRELKYTRP